MNMLILTNVVLRYHEFLMFLEPLGQQSWSDFNKFKFHKSKMKIEPIWWIYLIKPRFIEIISCFIAMTIHKYRQAELNNRNYYWCNNWSPRNNRWMNVVFCMKSNWPNIRGTNCFVPFGKFFNKIFNFLQVFKLRNIVIDNSRSWIVIEYLNEVRFE